MRGVRARVDQTNIPGNHTYQTETETQSLPGTKSFVLDDKLVNRRVAIRSWSTAHDSSYGRIGLAYSLTN